jgi:hypothetical protein
MWYPRVVTVIDFKTGSADHEDKYSDQIRRYMNIAKELYPTLEVRGLLAYLDGTAMVEVQL